MLFGSASLNNRGDVKTWALPAAAVKGFYSRFRLLSAGGALFVAGFELYGELRRPAYVPLSFNVAASSPGLSLLTPEEAAKATDEDDSKASEEEVKSSGTICARASVLLSG